jgi:hypothetical protein
MTEEQKPVKVDISTSDGCLPQIVFLGMIWICLALWGINARLGDINDALRTKPAVPTPVVKEGKTGQDEVKAAEAAKTNRKGK